MIKIIALLFVASLLVDVARASQYYEGAEEGGEVGGNSGDAYGSDGGEGVSDHGYGGESHGGHGGYEAGGYGAGGADHSYGHAFDAAILSHHEVKPYLVHSTGHVKPTVIDVEPGFAPILLNLLSKSSPLETSHRHIGEKGSFKKTFSSDKPHVWKHLVIKPVYTELKEIVLPYRKHKQIIKPVKKSIRTFVHKGSHGHYKKNNFY